MGTYGEFMKKILLYVSYAGMLVVGLLTASLSQDVSAANNDRLVVTELFTSQGCSSCPPADLLLEELRDRDGSLVLSWAVDYWDRLGWEDTFALPNNTMRQAAYNKRLGMGGVFTPQMVFNGAIVKVGSRRGEVEAAFDAILASDSPWYALSISRTDDDLVITLPPALIADGESLTVRLVYYTADAVVNVVDGENSGRKLHYSNIVRFTDIVADWTGKSQELTIDPAKGLDSGADHVMVLLQDSYLHGEIMGAAVLPLTDNPTVLNLGR